MSGSREEIDDSELFEKVFSEGPLEELTAICDVITTASLVGSSKHFFDSANDCVTLRASLPFGLPSVLHSHPTKVPRDCKLTPLNRHPYDVVLPDGTNKQWVGANGDWITMVDVAPSPCEWKLVNVYTRREIPLTTPFDTAQFPNICYDERFSGIMFEKINFFQVPTSAGGCKDFSLVAVFDLRIALLQGADAGWTLLTEQQSKTYFIYSDAILHNGFVFATTHISIVHAWNTKNPGPPLLVEPPPNMNEWSDEIEDTIGHDHEYEYGNWWLARAIDGSRLILVFTRGIADVKDYFCPVCHSASAPHLPCGRTVGNYEHGFGCLVFSKDTSKLEERIPWEKIDDLGGYPLFMGVNYPIMLPVGGVGVVLGYLTRSNCVYTLANAAWHLNSQLPEVCRFSLNGTDPAVGFQTNASEDPNKRNKYNFKARLVKTPLWFIPSFVNAPDWNKRVV